MNFFSFGVVICALFNFGHAIMCYECNSATNPNCAEAVLPANLRRNCSDHDRGVTHTLCRKIVQHVDFEVNGQVPQSRVIRTCGWDESRYKGSCYHRSGYGGRQEVCSCTKDLCNDAEDSRATFTMVATAVLLIGTKLYD